MSKRQAQGLPEQGTQTAVRCSGPQSPAETSTENLHRDWYGTRGTSSALLFARSNSRLACRSDVLVSVNRNRIRIVVSAPRRPHPENLPCRRRERCNPSRK